METVLKKPVPTGFFCVYLKCYTKAMELSIYKKIGIVFISFVALVVIVGLVMKMRAEKRITTTDSSQSQAVLEMAADEEASDSDNEADPDREQSGKDINTLLTEIESAADGDVAALDEEVADETQSVREGQLVIQEMGQSYDETSY